MSVYGPKATSAPTGAIILHPGDDISALVSAAPAGATFYLEAGVYRGVSLAPKDGQTFIGAEGAILNGSSLLTNWAQSGNLWVIGGQTQQGRVHPGAEFELGTQMPGYPETVFVDNTPLKPVDSLSKVIAGTFYFDYIADKIYIGDNPTGHTVEAGILAGAFYGNAVNVTVQNLIIEKYDPQIQEGAIRGGAGWTIRDNEVRLNYAAGISAGDGSQIIGNYVHDNGQIGLRGSGNNILVEGNEFASNGFWSGISPYWEAGGFKFSDTDNLVVRGNYAHDNKGTGMWTDINNIHTLYEDNLVVHNTINGISHEISYKAVIRNNTLIGNGYGDTRGWGWGSEINIQNSRNVDVYGNRVEMTSGGNGIVLIQQDRGSGTFGAYTTTGNQIHDNTIVDRDGHGYIGGFADYDQAGMLNGTNIWSNNQYFMSDGGDRFHWGGPTTFPQFKETAHETGSISQSYPNTRGWLTGSPAPTDAVLSIATASADKAEGQSGTTPFTFTITRTGDTGSTHSVSWSVAGSGADPASASDFVGNALPSGAVSFAAGETTKTVTVNVAGDTEVEPGEGFTVTLSSPSTGATLGTASAIGTIGNDDTEPSSPGMPDLAIGNLLLDAIASTVSFELNNIGTAAATNVAINLYLSADSAVTTADVLLSTAMIPFVAAGSAISGNASVTLPVEAVAGTYHLGAVADPGGSILEANELNNVANAVPVVLGTSKIDTLIGTPLADMLFGFDGDDTINGDTGIDVMIGGAGNDSHAVDQLGDAVVEATTAGIDTVTSSAVVYFLPVNVENLTLAAGSGAVTGVGNAAANVLLGNNLANTLEGLDGDDTLNGGGGNDMLDGGLGIDTADYSVASAALNIHLDTNVVDATAAGLGFDTLANIENATGGTGNDQLWGSDITANVFNGGDGNDWMHGFGGNDVLNGGPGSDQLLGGAGADTLNGGDGDDYFWIDELDTINGGPGTDYAYSVTGVGVNVKLAASSLDGVWGSNGNDVLDASGTTTQMFLIGYGGNDSITGGSGNDYIWVDFGPGDVIDGGAGHNELYHIGTGAVSINLAALNVQAVLGGGQSDTLDGSGLSVSANIHGLGGNDIITGGSAGDYLYGYDGDDTLRGNAGNDWIDGGAGTLDTALYAGVQANYVITNLGGGAWSVAGSGFTDTLVGVERLQFDAGGILIL